MSKPKKHKRQPKHPSVEVEKRVVYVWECPECGLEHEEDDKVVKGQVLKCEDEYAYLGCQRRYTADPF